MKVLSIEIDNQWCTVSGGIKSLLSDLRYIRRNWPGSTQRVMLTDWNPKTSSFVGKPKIKTITL